MASEKTTDVDAILQASNAQLEKIFDDHGLFSGYGPEPRRNNQGRKCQRRRNPTDCCDQRKSIPPNQMLDSRFES